MNSRAAWFNNTWLALLLCLLILPPGIYALWAAGPVKKERPIAHPPSQTKKTIFNTPYDFKTAFNNATAVTRLDYEIGDVMVTEGKLQNTFNATLNKHLALLGTINKETGKVQDVMMIGTSDGSIKSATDIFLCMATMIAAADPKMPAKERGRILKELGLLGTRKDIMNLNEKTERKGIKYFLSSSETTGFTFGASRN